MDRGNVSIEKVAEQFLVEGKEIDSRDGLNIADDYIPTTKDAAAVYCIVLIKVNTIIIIRRKKKKRSLKVKMISYQRRKMD